ncbi:hypothetical protein Tco_1178654 [Tanacetum coccineum]
MTRLPRTLARQGKSFQSLGLVQIQSQRELEARKTQGGEGPSQLRGGLTALRVRNIEQRRDLRKRLGSKRIHSVFGGPESRRGRSESPRKISPEIETVFKRLERGMLHRLGDKEKSMFAYSNDSRHQSYHSSHRDTERCYQSSRSRRMEPASKKHHSRRASSCRTEAMSESEDSA